MPRLPGRQKRPRFWVVHFTVDRELQSALIEQQAQATRLEESLQTQVELNETIARMGVPMIPVQRGVIVVPLIGTFDQDRLERLNAETVKRRSAV